MSAMIKSTDFRLPGGRSGVLLIHGLTGTPTEMRSGRQGPESQRIHRARHAACRALRRRGRPAQDRLARLVSQRLRRRRPPARRSRPHVRRRPVDGRAAGAQARRRPPGPGRWTRPVRHHLRLRRLDDSVDRQACRSCCRWSAASVSAGTSAFHECFPYGIKDERIRQRIAGSMLSGDSAAAGLPGNPWPSLAEFYRLSFLVRRQLRSIHTPCLVVHAVDDDVASLKNVRMVVRGVRGPVETVLLENSYHMITVDQERDKVIERSTRFFNHVANTQFRAHARTGAGRCRRRVMRCHASRSSIEAFGRDEWNRLFPGELEDWSYYRAVERSRPARIRAGCTSACARRRRIARGRAGVHHRLPPRHDPDADRCGV